MARYRAPMLFVVMAALPVSSALAVPGDLDTSFSRDGLARTGFPGQYLEASAVAVQPDGKVVIAGVAEAKRKKGKDFGAFALRYRRSGRLDSRFAKNGRARLPFGKFPSIAGVAIDSSGAIVVVGTLYNGSTSQVGVVRLTPAGDRDPSFSGDGMTLIDGGGGGGTASDLAVLDDRSVLITGAAHGLLVARLSANGELDPALAEDGTLTTDFESLEDEMGEALSVSEDGSITVTGAGTPPLDEGQDPYDPDAPSQRQFAARFASDGTIDPRFGTDGLALYVSPQGDVTGPDHKVSPDHLLLLPGGQAVSVLEDCYRDFIGFACSAYANRIDVDGQLVPAFAEDGFADLPFNYSAGIVADSRDRLLSAGGLDGGYHGDYGPATDFVVSRLTSDGQPDLSFGKHGVSYVDFRGGYDWPNDLALAPDGRILVAGYSDGRAAVARYEVRHGPPDLDGDQLVDKKDRCPQSYGRDASGCKKFPTSITFQRRPQADLFVGVVRARNPTCRSRRVFVYRRRRGPDKEVNHVHTEEAGRWRADASLKSGAYYATAAQKFRWRVGVCLAATSLARDVQR